jgi:hypothetical protein
MIALNPKQYAFVGVGKYVDRKWTVETSNAYRGLVHGFITETTKDGHTTCALVEKPDGTFDTPSVSVIKLLTPSQRV